MSATREKGEARTVTRRQWAYLVSLFALLLGFSLQLVFPASGEARSVTQKSDQADFPTVDPNYIYDQLFYMVTHYQRRESGYLKPPGTPDGHSGFAAYWTREITRDLQGFGPQTLQDTFTTTGWRGRPPTTLSTNVEVSVPGAAQPEKTVVIGCHYDGEASSTQSANDDASGCAIELGVAKALGTYWHTHNVYPARTLRFVIFDAEEQGLIGSYHYVNQTINGDLNNITAMFNEEQNGIAYPLRYLGKTDNPQLPLNIDISPTHNNDLYPHQDRLSATRTANIHQFNILMEQAIPAAFARFQALGDQTLTYQDAKNQPVTQSIFGSDQLGAINQQEDTEGGSDQIPFTLAGLPCATFLGNASYYDRNSPPPWSYPYDQPQDTIQLMNIFASGHSEKAKALTLSLALPGMLTTWMLHQPQILGETTTSQPIGTLTDIGQLQPGHDLKLSASAFEPGQNAGSALSYAWSFGDGSSGQGPNTTHRYQATGNYTLKLTITSPTGTRVISKQLNVNTHSPVIPNPYQGYGSTGYPPANPLVHLPLSLPQPTTPGAQIVPRTATPSSSNTVSLWVYVIILIVVIAGLAAGAILGIMKKRKQV